MNQASHKGQKPSPNGSLSSSVHNICILNCFGNFDLTGLIADIEEWKTMAVDTSADALVFASGRRTPLSARNVWQRNMQPKLKAKGLGWCTFQVMRRTFVSLCKAGGGDPKAIADQCGHDMGVSV